MADVRAKGIGRNSVQLEMAPEMVMPVPVHRATATYSHAHTNCAAAVLVAIFCATCAGLMENELILAGMYSKIIYSCKSINGTFSRADGTELVYELTTPGQLYVFAMGAMAIVLLVTGIVATNPMYLKCCGIEVEKTEPDANEDRRKFTGPTVDERVLAGCEHPAYWSLVTGGLAVFCTSAILLVNSVGESTAFGAVMMALS